MPLRAPAHKPDDLAAHRQAKAGALPFVDGKPDLPELDNLTELQWTKIARAELWGIHIPKATMRVALWSEVPFYVLCAYLRHESFGGLNLWGNDPTWMRRDDLATVGLEEVTPDTFRAYRCQRPELGMQGAGPLQLTHWTIQDRADELGGCHLVLPNLCAGAEWLSILFDTMTMWEAAQRWNGSDEYADRDQVLRAEARAVIGRGETP